MTTSGVCELFSFAPRRRKHGNASITSAWKMACVLLVLCAATAIVSHAQTFRTVKNLIDGEYSRLSLAAFLFTGQGLGISLAASSHRSQSQNRVHAQDSSMSEVA